MHFVLVFGQRLRLDVACLPPIRIVCGLCYEHNRVTGEGLCILHWLANEIAHTWGESPLQDPVLNELSTSSVFVRGSVEFFRDYSLEIGTGVRTFGGIS